MHPVADHDLLGPGEARSGFWSGRGHLDNPHPSSLPLFDSPNVLNFIRHRKANLIREISSLCPYSRDCFTLAVRDGHYSRVAQSEKPDLHNQDCAEDATKLHGKMNM